MTQQPRAAAVEPASFTLARARCRFGALPTAAPPAGLLYHHPVFMRTHVIACIPLHFAPSVVLIPFPLSPHQQQP